MKKAIRNIHLWLSMPLGLLISMICFSGAMLVFEKDINAWMGYEKRTWFFQTMFRMHRWLFDDWHRGEPLTAGKIIVGVSTVMFILALLSGLAAWLPKRLKNLKAGLKIRVTHGWHPFLYSLHTAGGMFALVILLICAFTGLSWSFPAYREIFYELVGQDSRRMVYLLHTGAWGGYLTKILWFLASLIGALLPLTGYYLFVKRKFRRD